MVRPALHGGLLLRIGRIAVIDLGHARFGMIQNLRDHKPVDSNRAHLRRHGPPQVMDSPRRDWIRQEGLGAQFGALPSINRTRPLVAHEDSIAYARAALDDLKRER